MHWVKPRVATTVGSGLNITVRASCALVASDRLIVELPGFSASGSSIPLDDGIWGASAAWDSQRLTFTLQQDQTYGDLTASIKEDALLKPSSVAFASAEFRMRIEARDCPTGWSHAKSPGVGLADARVAAFSAPFVRAGEAADVVLRFDAAEAPLVTGDSVTFKSKGSKRHHRRQACQQ